MSVLDRLGMLLDLALGSPAGEAWYVASLLAATALAYALLWLGRRLSR